MQKITNVRFVYTSKAFHQNNNLTLNPTKQTYTYVYTGKKNNNHISEVYKIL